MSPLTSAQEVEEVAKRREDQRAACDALRKKRFDEFMKGFSMINTKLKQMYRMITLGGDAEVSIAAQLYAWDGSCSQRHSLNSWILSIRLVKAWYSVFVHRKRAGRTLPISPVEKRCEKMQLEMLRHR